MNKKLQDEITGFNVNQMKTLFWQTFGWMENHDKEEINKAVKSAMIDARKEASK